MAKKISRAVLQPNLGLYLDRPSIGVPDRAVRDGNNFRVLDGELSNINLGWSRFGSFTLNGPVKLVQSFTQTGGSEQLVFATLKDIYKYVSATSVLFLTPIYATGTISTAGTAVTGVGTAWLANAKIGDEISFGSATQNDPAATWFVISNVVDDTHITLSTSAGVIGAGSTYTIRKLFTGTYNDTWDAAIFLSAAGGEDLLFLTNGVDDIYTWNGADARVTSRSALGFKCKVLRVYANMMIYLNLIQAGDELQTQMINSDVGNPLNVSTGLAAQFTVHDHTVSKIVDAVVLGDMLAVYSRRRVTLLQFLGDPLIFAFRQIGNEIGPIGPNVTADFGNYHEFIGLDGQYRFDGAAITPINSQVWKVVSRNHDARREGASYHFFDESKQELVWVPALTSDATTNAAGNLSPDTAYSEHYLEEVGPQYPTPYGKRTFPMTATGTYTQNTGLSWATVVGSWAALAFRWNEQFFFAAFPLIIGGDVNGKLYQIGAANTADGSSLPSFVVFPRRPTGDGRMRGLVARIYPFAQSVSGDTFSLNCSLLLSDSAEGDENETAAFPITLPLLPSAHFVSPYRRARYSSVKFSQPTGAPYRISGFDLDVKHGGFR